MSIKIVHDVLFLEMTTGRKLVLVALAEFADEDGYCWPSEALLAHKASIATRNLRNHLRGLTEDGWLQVDIGRGRGRVNNYFLDTQKIAEAADVQNQRIKAEKEGRKNGASPGARKSSCLTASSTTLTQKPDAVDQKEDARIRQNRNEPSKNRNVIVKEQSGASCSNFEEKPISKNAEKATQIAGSLEESTLPPPSASPPLSSTVPESKKFKAHERLCVRAFGTRIFRPTADGSQKGISRCMRYPRTT